ncbi:N-acyl-D-aspartate/D-glutamate deacylase [Stella humosa]|uniref:N-acyl-D-aspartate/D-glutamate deacylase n=1 Tax=Stella humosa TaxID=94 RepID=A0A3N1KUP1_9PROT|nr:amidohydrolase family protein [Stella humosa]ROP84301.1 N-acyl-D-aspartate/D-glutamate deacylase [Stella humosa]BBK33814.1 amidohydrolase [Stella humosa]
MFDTVFRNATIVDGTGQPAYTADLAVSAGRIAAIGPGLGPATETVEADGLTLMPGIIDGHTHYDAQLTWDAYADPSPTLGVTSVVIGNCGFTIAPCRPADRDLTMRNLTHVEGMSLEALRTGVRWDFEQFPEYLEMLERQGVAVNVAAFVGHSSVRTYVLGQDASSRVATDGEIAEMAQLVRGAMAAGAVGFATSTAEPHNGENGIPMPSRLADEREVRALVNAMGADGRGVYMLTRGQGTSIDFLESVAADSGRPVIVAATFYNGTNPTAAAGTLAQTRAARERGNRVFAQVSCCPLTMDFTLKNPYVFEGLAAWKPAMEAHGEAVKRVYADPAFRAAVKAELRDFRGRRLFNSQWERLHLVNAGRPENAGLEGRSLADLAAERGVDPLDCILDIALEEDLETEFTAVLLNAEEAGVAPLLTDPDTHISLSDAGAHLTFLCDAGYGLHLLGHWVRGRGVLSFEEAVRRLTAQPADLFGIADRGRLAPGKAADLLLVDPLTIGRGPKRKVHDLPAGAPRLVTDPVGIHGVWVNGTRIVDDNRVIDTGRRPGKVLREFAA